MQKTAETAPELTVLVSRMLARITALETWEHHARYPAATPSSLGAWLQLHYDAVPPAVSHALDGALLMHGLPPVADDVCVRFAELMQDVDDLVNFAERREDDGENDDLKMGIVSHPLVAAVAKDPAASALLERLWTPYRALSFSQPESIGPALARCHASTSTEYDELAAIMTAHGVPHTFDKIARDAIATIAAASPSIRGCVAEMVVTFVERLRRVPSLRPRVDACLATIQAAVDGLR